MARNSRSSSSLSRLDLNNWKDGEVSSFYSARTPDSGLKAAQDVIIEQNGTAGDRGSFLRDDIDDLPYDLLGNVETYKLDDNSENLICVLNNGTNGVVYVLDGTSWVEHDEILFDKSARVCLVQSADKVVVFNGKDAFSYYDISDDTVKRFAEVTDPVAPLTAVKSGLVGTAFTIYYRFSYTGNGGETNLSPAYSAQISALRENWTASDYFTITRPASTDPDAIDWSLWMVLVPNGSGTPTASDYELIKEEIPIATNVIVDNGKLIASSLQLAPETNTTAGIIAWYGENINGRIWALQDHTVFWGGDTDYETTFGGAKGSGFHEIDKFGRDVPMAVQLGRDNSGTSCINVLAAGVAAQGSIYDVYYNTISVGGTTVQGWEFKQREGNDGTNAPFSVLHANNNIYYLSLEGFKSTGVKPNIVGIQSTDIISNAIRDKVQLLTQSDLNSCYGVYFDEKIFWTVAYGTATNNQIWVYDILHGGVWTRWNVQADALFRWAKSNTTPTKLYIVKGKRILYYQQNSIAHQDDNQTFESVVESGIIRFKEDAREWAFLIHVIFVILKPIGKVTFSVTAHTPRGDVTKSGTVDFGGVSNSAGWGALSPSNTFTGSHNLKVHNAVYGELGVITQKDWIEVPLRVRKKTQYFTYKITSSDKNSSFMLSQVVPEFTPIGMGIDMLTRTGTIRI